MNQFNNTPKNSPDTAEDQNDSLPSTTPQNPSQVEETPTDIVQMRNEELLKDISLTANHRTVISIPLKGKEADNALLELPDLSTAFEDLEKDQEIKKGIKRKYTNAVLTGLCTETQAVDLLNIAKQNEFRLSTSLKTFREVDAGVRVVEDILVLAARTRGRKKDKSTPVGKVVNDLFKIQAIERGFTSRRESPDESLIPVDKTSESSPIQETGVEEAGKQRLEENPDSSHSLVTTSDDYSPPLTLRTQDPGEVLEQVNTLGILMEIASPEQRKTYGFTVAKLIELYKYVRDITEVENIIAAIKEAPADSLDAKEKGYKLYATRLSVAINLAKERTPITSDTSFSSQVFQELNGDRDFIFSDEELTEIFGSDFDIDRIIPNTRSFD